MLAILYLLVAAGLLWLAARFVRPLSRPAAAVLLVLPLALVGAAVVTGGVWGPLDHSFQSEPLRSFGAEHGVTSAAKNASSIDIFSEFFPWRRAVQRSLRDGEWPLWNPYNLSGHPLSAEVQSAPYLPLTWIACLLPAAVSLTFTAAIGLFLGGLGAFLFARELGCRESAALVAAAGWAFASCNVLYILTAMGLTTVFLPLILTATLRVARHPGVASCVFLMTALSLTILSGHPESLFLNVIVGTLYALFELARNRATAWRALLAASVAGALALALCAISLLPLIEAIPQSTEFRLKNTMMGERSQRVSGAEVLANLATDLYPHLHVREWAKPSLGRIGAETAAVGSLLLALAIYAIWRRRSAETWFFAALALFCMLAGARWSAIADAAMHLPLLEITMLHRLAFSAALFLVMLAALGVEQLLARDDRKAAAITIGLVCALLGLGQLWLQRNVTLAVTPADYGRYRVFAELFFPIVAVIALATARLRIAAPLLLALVIGQRALTELDTFPTFPAKAAYPAIPLFAPLQTIREPFRLVGEGTAFAPATNIFYGLEDPRGYDALTLDEYQRTYQLWCRRWGIWYNRVDDLTKPFLSFLNVRFAVQETSSPIPPGWREVKSDRGARLIENERVLPRIFIPNRVEVTGSHPIELVDRMESIRDFRDFAFITDSANPGVAVNGPGAITLRSRRLGGEYVFDAEMQRAGWVVISDCAWKGWKATIDGARMPPRRANAAFLGLFVPAGRHTVRVVYRPASFVRGRAITGTTLGALLAFAIVSRLRRARQRVAHRASE
ncbi:MAG TPA: YfhO family protein [Thermoanaerobaculia bacterium]|nr:YfhO family protein [Thermoanaerobaculia bacterium]